MLWTPDATRWRPLMNLAQYFMNRIQRCKQESSETNNYLVLFAGIMSLRSVVCIALCIAEDKIETFGQQINYFNWPDEINLSSRKLAVSNTNRVWKVTLIRIGAYFNWCFYDVLNDINLR